MSVVNYHYICISLYFTSYLHFTIGIKHDCEFMNLIINIANPLQNERRRGEVCNGLSVLIM